MILLVGLQGHSVAETCKICNDIVMICKHTVFPCVPASAFVSDPMAAEAAARRRLAKAGEGWGSPFNVLMVTIGTQLLYHCYH